MRKRILFFLLCVTLITAVIVVIHEHKEAAEPEITTSSKNTKTHLSLPNSYGNDQATHPKAVAFDKPWNGYRYWIAFTPYCFGNDETENPNILASNDLTNWEEPTGYKNPLEPKPDQYEKFVCYNSDTHLVYNDALNQLECWWRYVDDANDLVIIYRKSSSDGVHWSDKEILQKSTRSIDDYLSPSVIFEDGIYKIWTIGHGYKFRYWESPDGTDWQQQWEQPIRYSDSNLKSWHIDVIHTVQSGYEAVVVAFDSSIKSGSHQVMSLYYLNSKDNQEYSSAALLLNPTTGTTRWDNRGIYRSSLMFSDGKYYLFYSGIKTSEERYVGLISGDTIFNLR